MSFSYHFQIDMFKCSPNKIEKYMCEKYAFIQKRSTSVTKYKKGLLSIEAALVIPVFLMTMIMLLSTVLIFYVSGRIDEAICEESKYVAVRLYDTGGYNESYVKTRVEERLGESFMSGGLIKDGSIDFSDTDITNKELVVVSAKYCINLPYDLFSLCDFNYESKVIRHSWVGYINGLDGYSDKGEYVYITENASVYHKSRECSHLRLDIKSVTGSEIASLRNSSGGKYKKCIYCHPKTIDSKLYITVDGNKYHNSLSCSGLKRTILRVRLKDVGDLRPCLRCGN